MADSFPQIKHIVLLSLENRSFDHMLGGLPGVNGAPAGWTNSDGQRDYTQTPLERWEDAQVRSVDPDPMHETRNVLAQLENANRGFVADYATKYPDTTIEQRQKIMSYYPDGALSPLHTLAKTFAVCDRWHASVPGPTWTNRLFTLSGTARGRVMMPSPLDYDQPSLFRRLFEAGRSSRVYYGDVPLALLLSDQRVGVPEIGYDPSHSYYPLFLLKYLFSHAEKNFPDFVFIEPAYTMGPNDDHPPHDPIRGQRLIAEVYNELRASDALWKTALFVILYDEHGGFADHVPPPPDAVPPDDYNVDGFPFNRLGVRVPAVFISPWVMPQVRGELFDHTSLLRSLTEKWGLGPLGARTAAAADIFAALTKSPIPRADTPESVSADVVAPAVSPPGPTTDHQRAAEALAEQLDATPGLTPRERVERYLRPEASLGTQAP